MVDTTAGTAVESLDRATVVEVVSETMARVLVSTADADVVASIAGVVVSCCVDVPTVLVLSPPLLFAFPAPPPPSSWLMPEPPPWPPLDPRCPFPASLTLSFWLRLKSTPRISGRNTS